jgi:hypothetical protein
VAADSPERIPSRVISLHLALVCGVRLGQFVHISDDLGRYLRLLFCASLKLRLATCMSRAV